MSRLSTVLSPSLSLPLFLVDSTVGVARPTRLILALPPTASLTPFTLLLRLPPSPLTNLTSPWLPSLCSPLLGSMPRALLTLASGQKYTLASLSREVRWGSLREGREARHTSSREERDTPNWASLQWFSLRVGMPEGWGQGGEHWV